MAKYASIKTRPKTEAKPSAGTLAHNQRLAKNIELLPKEHRLPNYHLNRLSNVTKVFNDWKLDNEERYQAINGRKLRSDAHRMESLAIILSGEQVAKCDPDAIWKNANKFKEWFEARYKTEVRTMDWHRDEGHVNEDGKAVLNDHIHLEFDNVNEDGKMVRKLFSKGDLIKFQDKIAEIYKPLGFIRGENTVKPTPTATPKRGVGQKKYKEQAKKRAIEESRATQKKLKEEIAKLRAELQANKASRADYAKLEALKNELQAEIKAKNLTATQLEAQVLQFQKLKDENGKFREARASEHQRIVDGIKRATTSHKRATDSLERTTKADIERATKARQSERIDAEIDEKIGQFTNSFQHFSSRLEKNIYKLVATTYKNALWDAKNVFEALKSKYYDAGVAIKEKDAQIADLEGKLSKNEIEATKIKDSPLPPPALNF